MTQRESVIIAEASTTSLNHFSLEEDLSHHVSTFENKNNSSTFRLWLS
jgi:hypothetical protein